MKPWIEAFRGFDNGSLMVPCRAMIGHISYFYREDNFNVVRVITSDDSVIFFKGGMADISKLIEDWYATRR